MFTTFSVILSVIGSFLKELLKNKACQYALAAFVAALLCIYGWNKFQDWNMAKVDAKHAGIVQIQSEANKGLAADNKALQDEYKDKGEALAENQEAKAQIQHSTQAAGTKLDQAYNNAENEKSQDISKLSKKQYTPERHAQELGKIEAKAREAQSKAVITSVWDVFCTAKADPTQAKSCES